MAWYPEAVKKNINPGPNDPPIIAMGAILHVDSGNSNSLFAYFNGPSKGIESHFFVKSNGIVEQYRDTAFEADANLKANQFMKDGHRYGYVSIETQGHDEGLWAGAQLASIKKLLRWLSETHDFPLVKCKTPTSPGVGYHTLFGAPGPWTPAAKTCPGADRIRQFDSILVPWMASESGEEFDVISQADVEKIASAVLAKIEPRLKAYSADVKLYEEQTDDDDANRAADATVKALDARDAKATGK